MNFDQHGGLLKLYSTGKNLPDQGKTNAGLKLVAGKTAFAEDIVYSPDQSTAMKRLDEFLSDKTTCFSLVGPAGSGKTSLMKDAVKLAEDKRWTVCLSAPTHQAARRLREATGRHADTIHRLLGVKLVRDKKTGKERLKTGSPSISENSLVVVDESSMNPQRLVDITTKFADKHKCKVLFVGDAAQLNPVKEGPSITVDRDKCQWEMAELTTIHRQAAENPIIAAATAVRLADPKKLPILETATKGDHGVYLMENKREWADLMIEMCGDQKAENRYIGYTNRATDEAAKAIRRGMFGDDASEPYLPGEKLIVNSRCLVRADSEQKRKSRRSKEDEVVIQSNDPVTVKRVWKEGRMYLVNCDWHGHEVTMNAFANYSERDAHLARLRNEAIRKGHWGDFFEASDTIADLRSATTFTAHSSQGSTFESTFINLSNLMVCRNPVERQSLLYVALTRASHSVYLAGSLS